jgi:hypothetical protein
MLIFIATFSMFPFVEAGNELELEINVNPREPTNFQPTYKGEILALITVRALNNIPESVDTVLRLKIMHQKGKGLINTGFPHMEGKVVFKGEMPMVDNVATMEYVFPVRGYYLLEAELLKRHSMITMGKTNLIVHAKEPFFEIRNAIILIALVFVFGVYLGRVYGSAAGGV